MNLYRSIRFKVTFDLSLSNTVHIANARMSFAFDPDGIK